MVRKTEGKGGGGESVNGGESIVAGAGGLEEVSVARGEKPHPEPSSVVWCPTFAKQAKQEPWEKKKGKVVKKKEEAIGVK